MVKFDPEAPSVTASTSMYCMVFQTHSTGTGTPGRLNGEASPCLHHTHAACILPSAEQRSTRLS